MKGDAIAVPGFLDDAATAERSQFGGDLRADVAAHVAPAINLETIKAAGNCCCLVIFVLLCPQKMDNLLRMDAQLRVLAAAHHLANRLQDAQWKIADKMPVQLSMYGIKRWRYHLAIWTLTIR